jgi:hypothetical protein
VGLNYGNMNKMTQIPELNKIVDDARTKMRIIENRINKGGLTLNEQETHLAWYEMNQTRERNAVKKIKNILCIY